MAGMPGLLPAIPVLVRSKTWMPGAMGLCSGRRSQTRVPGMTEHADRTSPYHQNLGRSGNGSLPPCT
ncbi:hypothetical protein GGQ85_000551 [Nitrobacter vulgaris]|nr:hypothetical protein [Nitrobacter vulgaris]